MYFVYEIYAYTYIHTYVCRYMQTHKGSLTADLLKDDVVSDAERSD